ncbi:MAG: phosphoenolpyruvate--protein phosphotransferase [bacterium]|nr:phosphoenolpyruvate--protein phosphotransferase [bacterium]
MMMTTNTEPKKEISLKGNAISPGIIVGTAFIIDDEHFEARKTKIPRKHIDEEISIFNKAVIDTARDLRIIADQISVNVGPLKREIFDLNLMILKDPHVINETVDRIRNDKINADYAYHQVMQKYQKGVTTSDNIYLSERSKDIRDIKRRVVKKIQGIKTYKHKYVKNSVIVSRGMNFFDLFTLIDDNVTGILIEGGGRTTHIAIMIRSLEVPCIIGARDLLANIEHGDKITANCITGDIILNPEKKTVKEYKKRLDDFRKYAKKYLKVSALPSKTLDDHPFEVNANIELKNEVGSVTAHGEFGIGLHRTEYFYISEKKIPDEEEQYQEFLSIAESIHPYKVTIRTLDLGGDKIAPFMQSEIENNPFLGWRGIRICLDLPEMFRNQIRAILRASVHKNVRLMIPMIMSIDEVTRTKKIIEEEKNRLSKGNIPFDENIPVGVMIEVPSAVVLAKELAKIADFFSIGTNDLVQYTLAVDRGNERVSELYNTFHPAVLRMIKMTVEAAHENNIQIGMCGEMAGDPLAAFLLLGLGIEEFSVSPIMLLKIKQILRSMKMKDAEEISRKCLEMDSPYEIESLLYNIMHSYFPGMDSDDYFSLSENIDQIGLFNSE